MSTRQTEQESQNPIFIILGSGGHTAEMCKINKALVQSNNGSELYQPCYYLVASTDATSQRKVLDAMNEQNVNIYAQSFINIPRSREVGQSWFTTIISALWALLFSFCLIWKYQPKLVLCNGPGTCVPFCVAAYFLRMIRRLPGSAKIVFVESFCRVQTMSMSGMLLLPIVDLVVVQWPALAEKYCNSKNVQYFGRLM